MNYNSYLLGVICNYIQLAFSFTDPIFLYPWQLHYKSQEAAFNNFKGGRHFPNENINLGFYFYAFLSFITFKLHLFCCSLSILFLALPLQCPLALRPCLGGRDQGPGC